MVSKEKSVKEELKEEEQEENLEIANTENQKIELTVEAQNDQLSLPFERENIKNYLWKVLIIKKVEIRDVILKTNNEPVQVSYIDGYIIDNSELEQKLVKEITDNRTIPIDLVKEVNKHKKEVHLFSTSQGVYYSLMRSVVPKLREGAVIVGVALQESDYPQPMLTLVHPSRLIELKTQYEALNKGKQR